MPNNVPKEGDFTEMLRELEWFFLFKWQVGEYVQPGECTHVADKDCPRWEQFTSRIVDRADGIYETWPDLKEHEYDDKSLHMSSGKSRGRIQISPGSHGTIYLQDYDY